MKVSLNWAQDYSNVDLRKIGDDKLLEKIGSQLGAIDEVDYWGPRFDGITVVKVIECKKHNNADKLSICVVDDGGKAKDVERDKKGYVQVVCGAPNVRTEMLAAWIPPGVTVPSSLGKEPFVLEARDIRGQKSNGMLASASELGISDDHTGILEIKPEDVGRELAKPGTTFKKLYNLDDAVADIENKMFTHRPDCFGILGVARELAGIQGLKFNSPKWYLDPPAFTSLETVILNDREGSGSKSKKETDFSASPQNDNKQARDDVSIKLDVKVSDHKLVPRFMAVAMNEVKVGPSPVWLQAWLTRLGLRPINNVVDITNYVMHTTGQPLHAYDLDKLQKVSSLKTHVSSLETRKSRKGEKLNLLNGKELELQDDSTILITSNDVPVGIGGVMGGADTEVDENTKNIVLECATFDMYSIRRTAMKYGLFTDAVTRFTKGQSPLQNDRVLAYAMKLVSELASGKVAGDVKDVHGELPKSKEVNVHKDFVNARLGSELLAEDMAKLLRNVEFEVKLVSSPPERNVGSSASSAKPYNDTLSVTSPFWRTDIEIPEDIVEEIGRLYGFDQLPLELPKRTITPSSTDTLLSIKSQIRHTLSAAGANENLSYTFVHGNLLEKVGQNKDDAFQLSNALSPDLQYFRLSLTPSLLEKVHPNIKQGFNEFAIFEINPVHAKQFKAKDGLPIEDQRLALVFATDDKTAKQNYSGAPYYQAKKYLTNLLEELGITNWEFQPAVDHDPKATISQAAIAPFEPQRSAIIKTENGELLGEIGEFKSAVRKNLKLPEFVAGFEIDVAQLARLASKNSNYIPIPRFPKVEQDITLKVSSELQYSDLYDCVIEELTSSSKDTMFTIMPISIYQDSKNKKHKNISLRLTIASYEKTLKTQEVNSLLNTVATAAKEKFGAERL